MSFVNPFRLVIALVLFGGLVLPLYLFVLRPDSKLEPGFENAVLLDTPTSDAALKVGLKEGQLAPNFEISSVDGERVALSGLRGKPVLISFYALWCTSCLAEMPDIKELQAERGLDSFSVLAINTGETRERALEFIDYIQAPFTWGLDFDLTVSDAYGVFGLPYSIYIDSDGIVRAIYAGLAEKARLASYVDAAFQAGTPPAFPPRLRTISNIPRDRVLTVQRRAGDTVAFTSRSLRCDPSYCADTLPARLRALAGVLATTTGTSSDGVPTLEVRYDPLATSESVVVEFVTMALGSLHDPLYSTPLDVEYR